MRVHTRMNLGVLIAGATFLTASFTFLGCAHAIGLFKPTAKPKANPIKPVGDQGPAGQALPELASAPAPTWVKLGLRLTYHIFSSTTPGLGPEWKEDEDGIWKSEDGKRWTPSRKGSNAAEGYLQVDVTALPTGAAVIYANFYLVSRVGDPPKLAFSYPVIGLASNAGGFWVNPTELKKAKDTVTKDLKVLHMPYKLGDKQRPAVWIQTFTDKGNTIYVYDEATGVLLHDASSIEGKAQPVEGRNEAANTPSVTLSSGSLVGQRVVAYPWVGEDPKAWSESPRPLVYGGTTVVPTAGGKSFTLNQELSAKPQGNGPGWVRYGLMLTTTNKMGMPPTSTPSETISGLGQFGSAWLPPTALGKLTQGQNLDTDPITLTNVTVTSVTDAQVVITAVSPAQTVRWGYDRTSGFMVLIEKEDHNVFAPIKTRLTLQE